MDCSSSSPPRSSASATILSLALPNCYATYSGDAERQPHLGCPFEQCLSDLLLPYSPEANPEKSANRHWLRVEISVRGTFKECLSTSVFCFSGYGRLHRVAVLLFLA